MFDKVSLNIELRPKFFS